MAAPALEHAGQHLAAQLGGGEQVQGDHPLELVGGQLAEVGGDLDGGVVDEEVDLPVVGLDPRHQATQRHPVGEVAAQGAAADLGGERVEGLAATGDDRDVGAGAGEPGGEPGSDVAGGPGEEDVGTGDAHLASVHDGRAPTGIRAAVLPGRCRTLLPVRAVGCATPPRSALRKGWRAELSRSGTIWLGKPHLHRPGLRGPPTHERDAVIVCHCHVVNDKAVAAAVGAGARTLSRCAGPPGRAGTVAPASSRVDGWCASMWHREVPENVEVDSAAS